MNLKIFYTGLITFALATCSLHANPNQDAPKKIVVTITSSSINQSGFGLAVANAMQDAGVNSTVFVAGDAVKYALNNSVNPKFAGFTPKDLIQALIKKGGKVMICEGFVKLGNIKKTDMVQGVQVATPSDLAGALYAPNSKAMTF
ncbi:MAG: DsrE family protein [Sulfurovaceae bacterium]|nr:DsrE family protein [Sulfurovaceae bacterium]MDD5548830.1 DsrE family protein [Sulfurovaceae bacterium]